MPQQPRGRIMIVGGGIGGLSAAGALLHAGYDVTVFERANDLRKIQVGGTIIVWSNAMKALARSGLADRVQAVGIPLNRDTLYSWTGQQLGVWPVADMGQRLGAMTIAIGRGTLHNALVESLPEGVIQLSAQCADFIQDAGGVTLRLADGRQERGDALIGADGLKSTLRAQLLGPGEPRYAGYTIWQAHVQTALGETGVSQLIFGCGRRFVLAKTNPEHAHWFAVMNAPEDASYGKPELLERYRDWMYPVAAVIEETEEKAITSLRVTDRAPVKRWGEGRVTLLGDAAHPITWDLGQGGSQAIEDGMVLARCLAENDDVAAALRAYERRRIPRTALLARQSRMIGRAASWENPLLCRLRNTMIRVGWNLGMRAMTERSLIAYEA